MSWLRLTLAQFRLDQRLFWRNRPAVVSTFVIPIVLGGGLPMLLRRAGTVQGVRLSAYVLTGMVALVLLYSAFMNLTTTLTARRDALVLKRLRGTQLPDSAIFAGEVLNSMVLCLVQVAALTAFGRYAVGVAWPANPALLVLVLLLGTAALATLAVAYTAVVPNAEVAPVLCLPVLLAGFAASGIFARVEELPGWLRPVAYAVPMTPLTEGVRTAWFGADFTDVPPHGVARPVGALASFPALFGVELSLVTWLAIGAWLALRFFRWDRRTG